ncbi:MAG TPA: S8 family serine peptidase, partial [Actinomycetota bacterium]|nr:S8 family serine peptidase [Actinomycetota bacterium]
MSLTQRRLSFGVILSLVSLLGGLLAPLPARAADAPVTAVVDGAVLNAQGRTSALVHVAKGVSLDEGLRTARELGADTGTTYPSIKVFVAYGSAEKFERLAASGSFEYIEANRKIELFTDSSHKATRGQSVLDGNVTLPDGTTIDGSGVGVAVVDSGIDGTHPDLAGRMGGNVKILCSTPMFVASGALGGFQECLGPKTAVPMDDTDTPSAGGHGTHVAGIVAGDGTASSGTYHGAAPGATLYGVSVGTLVSVENGLDGLAWVLENHDQVAPAIKVVNNSWGSAYRKYQASGDVLYSATWKLQEDLIAAGVTVVFAAGNSSGNGNTPTTSAECINPTPGLVCVANYDDKGTGTREGSISSSSSRGKADQPENWPDVSAPGTTIVSTCKQHLPVCQLGGGMVSSPANSYARMSGTSMAAPHVAGIAAQLYQADPSLTPAEVENVLEDTAHKFAWGSAYGLFPDPFNPDDTSSFEKGHGLVDALAALQQVLGGGTPDPDPTPTPTTEPSPTPTASTPPPSGEGTSYYFHSPSGTGNADRLAGGSTFDANLPTFDAYSQFYDVPFGTNGAPEAVYDPYWTGPVESAFSSITLDFWAKTPVGDALGEVNYVPTVWVGATPYELPPLTQAIDPQIGDVPTRITKTYTTMLDASGNEVPLAIDPNGSPVTITLAGRYIDEEAGS